ELPLRLDDPQQVRVCVSDRPVHERLELADLVLGLEHRRRPSTSYGVCGDAQSVSGPIVTQTASAVAATSHGKALTSPTGIVRTTRFVRGSICETDRSPRL